MDGNADGVLALCGRFTVNSGATVTLNPGVYVFQEGIRINGGATLNGTEVTLYFAPFTGNDIDFSGGAIVDLSAPLDGSYAGMLIVQDPNTRRRCPTAPVAAPALPVRAAAGRRFSVTGARMLPRSPAVVGDRGLFGRRPSPDLDQVAAAVGLAECLGLVGVGGNPLFACPAPPPDDCAA